MRVGTRHRARDPRPAEDADEDVLPLPGGLRRRARTRRRARSASASRVRFRCRTATAIEWTVKLGLALGCEIAPRAVFARKNYFYPDLPKGYQISQYDMPSCINGKVIVPLADGDHAVGIVRAHLEEDAAKNVHVGGRTGRIGGADYTLVDYNRGGTPLVEIVDGARHPLGRGGEALPPAPAPDDRRARHLRRGDGEGDAARRRQRLRPPGRLRRAAHAVRDQEHELVHLRRPRDRRGGGAPDRGLGVRWRGRPGDLRLRRRLREADASADEGGGRRLPLLPRARPRCRSSRRPSSSSDCGRSCPCCRRSGSPVSERLDHERALVLVTGGLDGLWEATVAAGADGVAAANVIANNVVAAGVDPARSPPASLRGSCEARDRIPRSAFDEAIGRLGEPGFAADAVPRPGGRSPTSPSWSRSSTR